MSVNKLAQLREDVLVRLAGLANDVLNDHKLSV